MLVAKRRGIAQTHVLGVVSVLIIARVATALLAIHENCKLDQLVVYRQMQLPAGFHMPDPGHEGPGRCIPRINMLSPSVAFVECEAETTFWPYVPPNTGFRGEDKEIGVAAGRYRISLKRESAHCNEIIDNKIFELARKMDQIQIHNCIEYTKINSFDAFYELRHESLSRDGNYRYFFGNKFEIYGRTNIIDIRSEEKMATYGHSAISKSYLTFGWLEGLDPVAQPLWGGNFLSVCKNSNVPLNGI